MTLEQDWFRSDVQTIAVLATDLLASPHPYVRECALNSITMFTEGLREIKTGNLSND